VRERNPSSGPFCRLLNNINFHVVIVENVEVNDPTRGANYNFVFHVRFQSGNKSIKMNNPMELIRFRIESAAYQIEPIAEH